MAKALPSSSMFGHEMFASIARRYDTANEVLSLGIHKGWRRAAAD